MSLAVVPCLSLLSTSWRKHRHYRKTHPARTLALAFFFSSAKYLCVLIFLYWDTLAITRHVIKSIGEFYIYVCKKITNRSGKQENQDSYENSLFYFVTKLPDQITERKKKNSFLGSIFSLIKVMENRDSLTEMKGKNVRDVVPEISPTDFFDQQIVCI